MTDLRISTMPYQKKPEENHTTKHHNQVAKNLGISLASRRKRQVMCRETNLMMIVDF